MVPWVSPRGWGDHRLFLPSPPTLFTTTDIRRDTRLLMLVPLLPATLQLAVMLVPLLPATQLAVMLVPLLPATLQLADTTAATTEVCQIATSSATGALGN